jgi:ABC-type molybdate transport system substrate-binding protein
VKLMRVSAKGATLVGATTLFAAITTMTAPANAADTVLLHSAGSLRFALTEVIAAYEPTAGIKVQATFGASGTLKDAIARGERAEVFTSANMEHPQALADAKKSGPVVLFARNRLCALVRPGLTVTPATLLERMFDPNVKLATSTPKADPSGDYAWEVFRKADKIKPGSFAILEKRALQLVGAPSSAVPTKGRTAYGWHLGEGRADLFLTYCTNAMAAQSEAPGQQIVQLPDALAVGADYGMTAMVDAPAAAYRFAMFILSPAGQTILDKHGFSAPGLPR